MQKKNFISKFAKSALALILMLSIIGLNSTSLFAKAPICTTKNTYLKTNVCLSQFPYVWYGKTFTASHLTDTLKRKTYKNCDSIITLTVGTNISSTITLSVCKNQLPYVWNGKIFTTAHLTDTVKRISYWGCDSVINVNVQPIEKTSKFFKTLCNTQLPYVWYGKTFTANHLTDTIKRLTYIGCDSIISLYIVLGPDAKIGTTQTTVCPNSPVILNAYTTNSTDLFAYYKFDENTGTTINDYNSHHLNGSIVNSNADFTYNIPNIALDGYSLNSSSAYSSQHYVQVADTNLFAQLMGKLTLEAWVYETDTIDNTIIDKGDYDFLFQLRPNGQRGLGFYNHSTWTYSAGVVPINQWVHVAVTWDSTTKVLNFYMNGNLLSSHTRTSLVYTAGPMNIARQSPLTCACNIFDGYIDELRIWHSVRTPQELKAFMYTSLVPDAATSFTWSPSSNLNTASGTSVTATSANTIKYYLTGTDTGGCSSTDSITIRILKPVTNLSTTISCSQLPYVWQGKTFTVAHWTDTLKRVNYLGCDSIINLIVVINNIASTLNTQICTSQLPYIWFGKTFTASHLTDTLMRKNYLGCDSIVTLNLTIKQPSASTFTTSACVSYIWAAKHNTVYTSSNNTDTIKLVNYLGCDSIVTLHLMINHPSNSIISNSVCSGSLPYVWLGKTFTAIHLSDTLKRTNYLGCDSLITLQLKLKYKSTSNITYSICSGDSVMVANQYYKQKGTYTIHTTNYLGCDSAITLRLLWKQISSKVFSTAICQGDSVLFGGVYRKLSSNYVIHLTNYVGCDSMVTLQLRLKHRTYSNINSSICAGDSILVANHYYKQKGTYNIHTTNYLGCDSAITFRLYWKQTSSRIINATICQGDSILFGGVYRKLSTNYVIHLTNYVGCDSMVTLQLRLKHRSYSNINSSICAGDSILVANHYYKQKGTYTIHTTNYLGCDSAITFRLYWKQTSSRIINATICQGDSVLFGGVYRKLSSNYVIHLTNYIGCDSMVTLQLRLKHRSASYINSSICSTDSVLVAGTYYKTKGTYNIHTMNYLGCDSSITLKIYYKNSASITFDTICQGQSTVFNGFTYSNAGNYYVHFTNYLGCDSIACLRLKVNSCLRLSHHTKTQTIDNLDLSIDESYLNLFPNPNDGTFTLENNCTTCDKMQVEIYNVSGQLVYSQLLENTAGKMTINQNLSAGMYLVRLSNTDNNFLQSKSFVVK